MVWRGHSCPRLYAVQMPPAREQECPPYREPAADAGFVQPRPLWRGTRGCVLGDLHIDFAEKLGRGFRQHRVDEHS